MNAPTAFGDHPAILVGERFAAINNQHVVTFGGHAVACAAALANIAIIEREGLVERSARMGAYFKTGLNGLNGHRSFGEVRGLGLMCALQLRKNRTPADKFNPEERTAVTNAVIDKCFRRGLNIIGSVDKFAFMPPLIITKEELDRALEIVDTVLTEIEAEFS